MTSGLLGAVRLAGYRKLRAEAAYERCKVDPRARAAALAEHKSAIKSMKYHPKFRKRE